MSVYNEIPKKHIFKNPVITIGSFDGVHMGHKKILSTLKERADEIKGETIVLTFSSHPRKVLNPDINIKIITTTEEKIRALRDFGIDHVILLNFTREISLMHAYDFYNEYLIKKIGVKEIVIGYDHAFGKDREGNVDFLYRLSKVTGVGITRVHEKDIQTRPVSSTWIRNELEDGNMALVTKLLGRHYALSGSVVKGAGRGRNIGFPTANISPDDMDKIIPGDGVYAVYVYIDGHRKQGLLNIGNNPTFSQIKKTIEVHIVDFNKDIYDNKITIEFIDKIRNEIKFKSVSALVKQIEADKTAILNRLHKHDL